MMKVNVADVWGSAGRYHRRRQQEEVGEQKKGRYEAATEVSAGDKGRLGVGRHLYQLSGAASLETECHFVPRFDQLAGLSLPLAVL